MKECSLETFIFFWEKKIEGNEWDFKRAASFKTKTEKYRLIKDFMGFANYGGGYLLLGIDEKDKNHPCHVDEELDPADIGDAIEKNIGATIEFKISYFENDFGDGLVTVGLIIIQPSERAVTSFQDRADKDGVIIRAHEFYTRRNTRTVKATTADVEKLIQRTRVPRKTSAFEEVHTNISIYNDETSQECRALWNVLDDKFEFSTDTMAPAIRLILLSSRATKKEFAQLHGISGKRLDNILIGTELPSIEFLVRLSKYGEFELNGLFEPTYYGRRAFWKEDDLRIKLLGFIQPTTNILQIKHINVFLGRVVYETAEAIILLHENIYPKQSLTLTNEGETHAPGENTQFHIALAHQYYKLLEQVQDLVDRRPALTPTERIIALWFFSSTEYLVRIFAEAIKSITVSQDGNPKITFYFVQELQSKVLYSRTYCSKTFRMKFGQKVYPTVKEAI